MAVHGQSEPPRTLAAWHRFQEECWRQERHDWLPGEDSLTFDGQHETKGLIWFTTEDHPYKGQGWCWRCLAEAQGFPVGRIAHHRQEGAICWGPAEGDASAKDRQQDARPPGDESTSDWTEAGRRFVAEGADTGTFFYTPPSESPPAPRRQVVQARSVRFTPLDAEGNPVGPPQDISDAPIQWDGWPSWTDDLPLSDIAKWPPPPIEIPLPPDVVDAALKAIEQAGDGS